MKNTNSIKDAFKRRNYSEAMELLGTALSKEPDEPLLETAFEWLNSPGFLEQADQKGMCQFISRLIAPADQCRENLKSRLQAACLQAIRTDHGRPYASRTDIADRYSVEARLLRHMNRIDEALAVAEKGSKLHDSSYCSIFAGLCCMDLEQEEQAEYYIRRSVKQNPDNMAGFNDFADFLFQKENYEKAGQFYHEIMENGDSSDREWAVPSYLFCRYQQTGAPDDLERLTAYAAAYLDCQRSAELCGRARRQLMVPYVQYFPDPRDSIVNMLHQILDQSSDLSQLKVATTLQPPASSVNALTLAMSHYHSRNADLSLTMSHFPDPPLDSVMIPEGMVLWTYDSSGAAHPAVQKPSRRVYDLVDQLAREPYDLGEWYQKAAVLSASLSAEDTKDLYASMVYPEDPEAEITPDLWLMRIQYAAVCLLSYIKIPSGDHLSVSMQRYVKSLPSPELAKICLGQLDWPVIPALTLLAWQAKEGIADPAEVNFLLDLLTIRMPENGYCFFRHALVCALSWVPGRSQEFYQLMKEQRRALESED